MQCKLNKLIASSSVIDSWRHELWTVRLPALCAPPPLGRVQKPGSEAQVTLEGERQKHTKAIQDMVAKDAQSHHSDLDSVVNALADVAAARTSTKRGPPESTAAEPQGQSSSSRLSYISS